MIRHKFIVYMRQNTVQAENNKGLTSHKPAPQLNLRYENTYRQNKGIKRFANILESVLVLTLDFHVFRFGIFFSFNTFNPFYRIFSADTADCKP